MRAISECSHSASSKGNDVSANVRTRRGRGRRSAVTFHPSIPRYYIGSWARSRLPNMPYFRRGRSRPTAAQTTVAKAPPASARRIGSISLARGQGRRASRWRGSRSKTRKPFPCSKAIHIIQAPLRRLRSRVAQAKGRIPYPRTIGGADLQLLARRSARARHLAPHERRKLCHRDAAVDDRARSRCSQRIRKSQLGVARRAMRLAGGNALFALALERRRRCRTPCASSIYEESPS